MRAHLITVVGPASLALTLLACGPVPDVAIDIDAAPVADAPLDAPPVTLDAALVADAPLDAPPVTLDAAPLDAPADAPRLDAPADAPRLDVPADAPRLDVPADAPRLDAPADTTGADVTPDAPAPVSLRIVVISDLNDSYGATTYSSTVRAAVTAITDRVRPDLVLVTGDMVAGQRAGLDYAAMWAGWHRTVSDPLRAAGIPLAVTPGNHDASGYTQYAAERAVFVSQWTPPSRVPAVTFVDRSRYPLRYSFTYRGAFFVSLDATTVGPLSAEQRAWVDAQLAASTAPIKIAYGHLSLHPVTVGRETEVLADAELEAIFRRRGLTAYVSGHQHGYYPGARNGLRLVSMACLGAGSRTLVGTSVTSPLSMLAVEVRDGRITSLEALAAPGFTRAIDRATLPAELRYGAQRVTRDDLAGF
jgi:hypothetical protein